MKSYKAFFKHTIFLFLPYINRISPSEICHELNSIQPRRVMLMVSLKIKGQALSENETSLDGLIFMKLVGFSQACLLAGLGQAALQAPPQ